MDSTAVRGRGLLAASDAEVLEQADDEIASS
jgi:hypothetical protein